MASRMKIKLSPEEKFTIDLLFKNGSNYEAYNKLIDINKLVKFASSHLILPLLYAKFERLNISENYSAGFLKYLKEIYEINYNRNKELIIELRFIDKLFKKNKISYTLMKGAALISNEVYESPAERMIGDIDLLVDSSHIKIAFDLLKSNGYNEISKFQFFEPRHLKRLAHSKKLFAVELHNRCVEDKYILKTDEILKNIKNSKNSLPTMQGIDLLKSIIYNMMLNDYSSKNSNYSYRVFYDFYKVSEKYSIELKNLEMDSDIKKFFIITNILGLTNLSFEKSLYDRIFIYKFLILSSNKLLFRINFILNKYLEILFESPKKLGEFFTNKNYRIYLQEKIKNR